jgi:hypothetical protein
LLLSAGNIPISAAEKSRHQEYLLDITRVSGPADTIRVAAIGMGIMGYNDTATAVQVPGVKLVAACDLYTGRWPAAQQQTTSTPPTVYRLPDNYNEDLDHHTHFFDSVRTGKPVVEDPVFGPCPLANQSYFHGGIIHWDPVAMKVVS